MIQIFSINALYIAACDLRSHMSGLEWYNLQKDLQELAMPKKPVSHKLQILSSMSRSYSVFHD